MAIAARLFATDEELGKRDDDHKPSKTVPWRFRRKPQIQKRRIFLLIVLSLFAWAFIHNMPTDLKTARERFPPIPMQPTMPARSSGSDAEAEGSAATSQHGTSQDRQLDNYDGPIEFSKLGDDLIDPMSLRGQSDGHNVLFAVSDLKTASAFIPVACEMSRWKRNNVHMAFMGPAKLSLKELLEVNGVTEKTCDIRWHDARPDHASTSTPARMEASVMKALNFLQNYLSAKVLITAAPNHDDDFFVYGIRIRARELNMQHIELIPDQMESLLWLTRLDSDSLAAWNRASIELLVHAEENASGSLIRLARSLRGADYSGFGWPRLTIELPAVVSKATRTFLNELNWPSNAGDDSPANNQLILRHRINGASMPPNEASFRFIESFYPAKAPDTHVLLLSPQAEVSPLFFQYLRYQVLEYKYSATAQSSRANLFGINLATPDSHLNGSEGFLPPTSKASASIDSANGYLWQAPGTDAALYFGDMWLEFHSHIIKRNAAASEPSVSTRLSKRAKYLATSFPAWAEFILEYMQIRGYSMLQAGTSKPGAPEQSHSVVVVHTDLSNKGQSSSEKKKGGAGSDSDYLSSHKLDPKASLTYRRMIEASLVKNLRTILPEAPSVKDEDEKSSKSNIGPVAAIRLSNMTILNHLSETQSAVQLASAAAKSTDEWRRTIGGCSAAIAETRAKRRLRAFGSAADLYCLDDEDEQELSEEVSDEEESGYGNDDELDNLTTAFDKVSLSRDDDDFYDDHDSDAEEDENSPDKSEKKWSPVPDDDSELSRWWKNKVAKEEDAGEDERELADEEVWLP